MSTNINTSTDSDDGVPCLWMLLRTLSVELDSPFGTGPGVLPEPDEVTDQAFGDVMVQTLARWQASDVLQFQLVSDLRPRPPLLAG